MRCPICKKEAAFDGNPFRPFCSERCRLIDLDNWLSGRYRISTPLDREKPGEAVKQPTPAESAAREGDSGKGELG